MLVYDDGTIYKCTNVGSDNAAANWEELKLGANLDDLEIGGRNLVLKSDGSSTTNIYAYGDCYNTQVVNNYDGGTGNEICIRKIKQPDAGYTYAQSVWIVSKDNFELDTDYVLSFDARLLQSSGFTSIPVYLRLAGTAYDTTVMKKVEVTKTLQRVSVVLHSHPTDPYNYGTLFIGVPTTIIYISKVKLEKGNKATDWTPALEDYLDLSTMNALNANNATYATYLGSSSNKVGVDDVVKKQRIAFQDTATVVDTPLSSIQESGFYRCGSIEQNSGQPDNKQWGQLIVSTTRDTITQLYGAYKDNTLYFRSATLTDLPKTSWKKVANIDDLQGTAVKPIQIPENVDLNNYTTSGFYYCPYTDTAATLSNCPVTIAFNLVVKRSAGYIQELTTYQASGWKKYERHYYGGKWGAWKQTTGDQDIYLPLTGGTLTGGLHINQTANYDPFSSSFDINSDPKLTIGYTGESTGARIAFTRSTIQAYSPWATETNKVFDAKPLYLNPLGGALRLGDGDSNGTLLMDKSGYVMIAVAKATTSGTSLQTNANVGDLVFGNSYEPTTIQSSSNLRLQPASGKTAQVGPDDTNTNLTMTSGSSPQITIGPSIIKYNKSTGCLEIQG